MFKELKYLFFILFIILTIFLAVDYYFSDNNKKKSYRSVQEINEMIISYSEKLILLNNDTDKNIVAIGECGLDYYHGNEKGKELQKKAFRQQIELALEYQLPLMLHIRPSEGTYDAYEDVLAILKGYKTNNLELIGDVHFFAGTVEIAQEFLDMGFYISFTGVITFAKVYEELVSYVPLDRILSETDAPYVAPIPFRGKRNEPSHVREVVKKIAEIKELDENMVAEQIMKNAKKLFRIE